jgi:hypothetical protein
VDLLERRAEVVRRGPLGGAGDEAKPGEAGQREAGDDARQGGSGPGRDQLPASRPRWSSMG